MGNEPRTTRDIKHSVIVVTSLPDPRRRGSAMQGVAIPGGDLLADQFLDYGPVVPDAAADGTLPIDKLSAPLLVTALKWKDNEPGDLIFLHVDDRDIEVDALTIDDQPDPIEMTLPVALLDGLAEGEHVIFFKMGSGFGDSYISQDTIILIDRTPPGGDELPLIRFKLDYEQNGVTIYQIQADGDVLNGTIATYESQKPGDTIATFIQTQAGGAVTPGPVLNVATSTENHPVAFTLAQLQAAGANGGVDFWYIVKDKAGNPTTAGKSVLRMLVTGAPDQLEPPRVPLFADDDLVNELDGRTPITVEIPEFGHAAAGDEIVLLLGPTTTFRVAPPLDASDLPADPDNPDPSNTLRSVEVPYAVLASLGANPIFTFDCSYRIERSIFKIPAPALAVDVDLTLAGGPDPDPETPEHGNYEPPVVAHAGPGAVDNIIPVNYTPPVIATVSHLGVDATELFVDDDVVQLYRYDVDGTTRLPVGDETAAVTGADVEIELSASDLVAGVWPFFYEVGRELPTGQINWGISPSQDVTIEDGTDLPGGTDPLPDARFRNADIKQGVAAIGYTRSQTHSGTLVRVYDYLNMKLGDRIVIHWQGHDNILGNGADIPDAVFEATHEVTEADLLPKDDRLEDDTPRPPTPDLKIFVQFLVPYEEMQKIKAPGSAALAFGSAWLHYEVTSATGKKNTSKNDRDKLRRLAIDARAPSAQ